MLIIDDRNPTVFFNVVSDRLSDGFHLAPSAAPRKEMHLEVDPSDHGSKKWNGKKQTAGPRQKLGNHIVGLRPVVPFWQVAFYGIMGRGQERSIQSACDIRC